ncbi:phage tail assembly chaperone family protein, TAC [Singulisphaera acidiphila]|uniref:Phage tail assembly chaperone n=1 Tax=Singulisphaera acidiphila (strain ATCC BAA-1392 / DSM 18658 / VKM B-2454 / MOB10) TaxID=886293 RepID=L0DH80_SINAD|nr:phage tail assembly chaperone family protein, TAC [Singulisphaera acidiphila]AGA28729.1 hypothetical protein Sinac_4548 [Singulisphaera acidiphila DSM 18658]
MSLTRDQILASDGRKRKKVEIPDLGGSVFVQSRTARQQEQWEAMCSDNGTDGAKAKNSVRSTVAVMSVCDEDGNPMFTEADIPALNDVSCRIMIQIWDAAMEVNSLVVAEPDAAAV